MFRKLIFNNSIITKTYFVLEYFKMYLTIRHAALAPKFSNKQEQMFSSTPGSSS